MRCSRGRLITRACSRSSDIGGDWLLFGLLAGMEGLCRLNLSQMRPCTLACLVANKCSILDHRNHVWLLMWTVLWYELVCLAVFGLVHDTRCEQFWWGYHFSHQQEQRLNYSNKLCSIQQIGLKYQLLLSWPWAWSIRNKVSIPQHKLKVISFW